ncbi:MULTISPECIES: flavin reductase family protein [Streptomyces]|uniref:flavin reductase family protein n=1 Tax=Streptomyces TaxID=1883 RepID=UPI0029AA4A17|nr:flavin reductase family protein [Streptomyces sp. WI03-4A]MDX2593922.1 flavin reductase family protein [Streptomyces sp. WI03-4A]
MSTSLSTSSDNTDIRPLMSCFPSGVSVVTALGTDSAPRGMTCSSLASVALDPATLVVCLRTAGPTLRAALDSGRFAVNLLDERARAVSDLFASGATDRFERAEWRLPLGAGGPHLTGAALAVADCEVTQAVEVGDHTAVFGRVTGVTLADAGEPLLYGRRRYARWSVATSPLAEAAAEVPLSTALEGDTRVGSRL